MAYVHVTADAGVASTFYQILLNNPDEDVIINLEDFHAVVEFYGIMGKIISGNRFEDVVHQADLCTWGCADGVINGKHHNRSWSIH